MVYVKSVRDLEVYKRARKVAEIFIPSNSFVKMTGYRLPITDYNSALNEE
jgi:hypothetical protein